MNSFQKSVSEDGVLTITFDNLKSGWEQHILLTSDRHWDSRHSDRKMQKRHLERAMEHDALIMDFGDLFDAMQGRNDRRGHKSAVLEEFGKSDYFNQLVDGATEWFSPYAKNWLMLGTGNHETAIVRHNEFNLTKQLCWNLNREGGDIHLGDYSNYVQFKFQRNGRTMAAPGYNMWYHHGYGGNAPRSKGVLNVDTRAAMYPDADLFVAGHIHQSWEVHKAVERLNKEGKISKRIQTHLQIPSYKGSTGRNGWEVEKGMGPSVLGAVWWRMYFHNEEVFHEFTQIR